MRTEDLADIEQRLDSVAPRSPRIDANSIGGFVVTYNDATLGTSVAFTVASVAGMSSLQLKRNFSRDPGSAVVLQSWGAGGLSDGQQLKYDDNDPSLRANQSIYYWIDCIAFQVPEENITVGPQTFTNNADTLAPDAILDFDASHEAVSGGTVLVSAAFNPPVNGRFASCKIYVTGYNGVAASQALAQNATSPWRFTMLQTGETVTLTAIAVSLSGIEALTGPTKSLTLGAAATVPAKPMGVTATEIATGIQIGFPASAESNVTSYKVKRALLNAGFGASSTIATVVSSGASAYTSLDTNGLKDVYEYYVVATSAAGDSSPSAVAIEDFVISSARLPINTVQYTNNATIDSIDAGASATVRVYGPGGVGSAWDLKVGYGNTTGAKSQSAQTFTGKSYVTKYFCYWNGSAFILTTTFFDTLPDGYWFVGAVTTVAAGGGGGTGGGGGSDGGGPCFSGNTKILTLTGVRRFDELPHTFVVFNRSGKPRGARLLIHDYEGPMHVMGDDELVTPTHQFARGLKWVMAKFIFPMTRVFNGKVYNAVIVGEKEFDEQHYVLANGEVAHNSKPSP